jgi:DNA oxidative demethylase
LQLSQQSNLFADEPADLREDLCAGAAVLREFALPWVPALQAALAVIIGDAPFRHLVTPGGYTMSVAMTNCGAYGWVSDRKGYRYSAEDPLSGQPWPPLPSTFLELAQRAADALGFAGFVPDCCLVNRYSPGTKLSLHIDQDELNFGAPIVSVSLGVPATFLFGGPSRKDRCQRITVRHGDVAVWGGPARRFYHGVATLKQDSHLFAGEARINLTFRRAR